jgi:hypothetical protein
VERDNAEILKCLKTRTYDGLKKHGMRWIDAEVTLGSLRVHAYDEAAQDQLRREDIDLVDERRWQSAIKKYTVPSGTQTLPRVVRA